MNKRNKKIADLSVVVSDQQTSVESRLVALRKLTQLRPGKPLGAFIRMNLKQLLASHPELLVDVRTVLDDLREARIQKLRFLELKKSKPTPPFSVPLEFRNKFEWIFKIHREGRIEWQLLEK